MTGKKFTSRMNLWNANSQAVDIARRELKSLRTSLGLGDHSSDPAEFVHKPLVLDISVKARKDDVLKMENNLVNILPYGNAPPVATSAPQYQPQPAPPPQYQPPQQPVGYAQPAQQPNWQPPAQQPMPPAAFAPAPGAPPPWAAR
jgi:hypothetical protein